MRSDQSRSSNVTPELRDCVLSPLRQNSGIVLDRRYARTHGLRSIAVTPELRDCARSPLRQNSGIGLDQTLRQNSEIPMSGGLAAMEQQKDNFESFNKILERELHHHYARTRGLRSTKRYARTQGLPVFLSVAIWDDIIVIIYHVSLLSIRDSYYLSSLSHSAAKIKACTKPQLQMDITRVKFQPSSMRIGAFD